MYNYPNYKNPGYAYKNPNDDRFIAGGFLGPFLLGGITGGLLAPAFGAGYRPCCPQYPYPYPNYNPYYGPYYR